VKTQKIERRQEQFSEIDRNRTSPRSLDDRNDTWWNVHFYAIAVPLRLYTAKTQSGILTLA
jgi:hypothetical protein